MRISDWSSDVCSSDLIGRHRFNVSGKRKGEQKSEDEIVDVAVEPIIDEAEFAEVQAVMRSRSPQLKAPRFVTAGTLLGGVRSDEGRVGKECVSTCRSRWSPFHLTKKLSASFSI